MRSWEYLPHYLPDHLVKNILGIIQVLGCYIFKGFFFLIVYHQIIEKSPKVDRKRVLNEIELLYQCRGQK